MKFIYKKLIESKHLSLGITFNAPWERLWKVHCEAAVKDHEEHKHRFSGIVFRTWQIGRLRCVDES